MLQKRECNVIIITELLQNLVAQARTEGGFGRFGRTALLKKGPQFTL